MPSIIDRLLGRESAPTPRSIPAYVTSGSYPLLPFGVSTDSVLALSAVVRSLQIIADGLTQLPWVQFGTDGRPVTTPDRIVMRPYEAMTRRQWVAEVCISLALENLAYLWRVEGQLLPVPVRWILPATTSSNPLTPAEAYRIGNLEVPAEDVIVLRRLPFPGVPPQLSSVVRLGRAEFAAMLAADVYVGRYWSAGGAPVTTLKTDQPLTLTQAEDIRGSWATARSMGPDYPAILHSGIDAQTFGADPTTDTGVAARREMIADVARYFGIPIRKLESVIAGASNTYQNVENEGLELVRGTLSGYMGIIEDAITDELAAGHIRLNPDPLTRPSMLNRYQAYAVAIGAGFLTPDEARAEEGLSPLPAGYTAPGVVPPTIEVTSDV